MRDEVLLAYEMNGQPAPAAARVPAPAARARLVRDDEREVADRRITAVAEPFDGFQMEAYRVRQEPDEAGVPVTRMQPRALMVPPGIPDFLDPQPDRGAPATHVLQGTGVVRVGAGRAGRGERSTAVAPGATRSSAMRSGALRVASVDVRVGRAARASTSSSFGPPTPRGNEQPLEQPWNHHGFENNAVQRVR